MSYCSGSCASYYCCDSASTYPSQVVLLCMWLLLPHLKDACLHLAGLGAQPFIVSLTPLGTTTLRACVQVGQQCAHNTR